MSDHVAAFATGADTLAGSEQPHRNHPSSQLATCVWATTAGSVPCFPNRDSQGKGWQHLS